MVGGWFMYIPYIVIQMKDVKYKIKCIRMHEETWKKLKEKRQKSNLSWNRFLLKLLDKR